MNTHSLFISLLIIQITFFVLTLLFYIAASWVKLEPTKKFFRKLLIINNVFGNMYCWYLITDNFWFCSIPMPLLASLSYKYTRNKTYQTLIAFLNFILPMSWAVSALGIFMLLINIILHPLWWIKSLKIHRTQWLPQYASIAFHGGTIQPRVGYLGFNMGCCTFMRPNQEHILLHEMGHQLNLCIFGAWFHYIGALDENFIHKNPCSAYAELLADSICTKSNHEWCIWS